MSQIDFNICSVYDKFKMNRNGIYINTFYQSIKLS